MTMSPAAAGHRTNNKDNRIIFGQHGIQVGTWNVHTMNLTNKLRTYQWDVNGLPEKESMSEKTAEGVAKSSFVENQPPL